MDWFRSVVCLISFSSFQSAISGSETDIAEVQHVCESRLCIVYEAIQAYKAQRGQLPGKLGDLVPDYISDSETLRCPTAGYGDYELGRDYFTASFDVDLLVTYSYEFHDILREIEFSDGRKQLLSGQQRKSRILSTPFGDRVPIVSCLRHLDGRFNRINLSYGGEIYRSHEYWECHDPDLVPAPYLTLWHLGTNPEGVAPRIPERSADTAETMLDLTAAYNAHPEDAWYEWMWDSPRYGGAGLPGFSLGVSLLKNEIPSFDARGIIQLNGSTFRSPLYPLKSREIAVGLRAAKIHVLLGSHGDSRDGVDLLGHVHLRYAGGATAAQEIYYGKHVSQFDGDEIAPAPVAWEGLRERDGATLRLYHLEWENPHPEKTIEALWFSSPGTAHAAPFFLAASIEN